MSATVSVASCTADKKFALHRSKVVWKLSRCWNEEKKKIAVVISKTTELWEASFKSDACWCCVLEMESRLVKEECGFYFLPTEILMTSSIEWRSLARGECWLLNGNSGGGGICLNSIFRSCFVRRFFSEAVIIIISPDAALSVIHFGLQNKCCLDEMVWDKLFANPIKFQPYISSLHTDKVFIVILIDLFQSQLLLLLGGACVRICKWQIFVSITLAGFGELKFIARRYGALYDKW